MTAMHLIPQIQSLVYNASTCLIRFLYVRSSLQVNIQEVYRRNQFTLMFILIGEGINVFNLVSALYYRKIFTEWCTLIGQGRRDTVLSLVPLVYTR